MRIAHIISPGGLAGAERVVIHGVEALLELGADLRLFMIQEQRSISSQRRFIDAAQALPLTRILAHRQLDVHLWRALRQQLKDQEIDLIHAHGFKALFYATMSAPADLPIVCTHHGETAHDPLASHYELLARHLYHRAQAIFAVSEPTARQLRAQLPLLGDRIHVIENFLTRPSVSTPHTSRAKDAPLRLLSAGRLSQEKNLLGLLDALERVAPKHPITLDILGDGPQAAQLKERIQALQSAHLQVTLRGFIQDVQPWLTRADALVLPSHREAMPLIAIEALCAGVPVIATRVGSLPAMIEHGRNGLLIPSPAAQDIASTIAHAAASLDTLTLHAQAQAKAWQDKMSPKRWASQTLAYYQDITQAQLKRSA